MCHAELAFTQYCDSTLLPRTSQLHGWIDDSLRRVRQAAQEEDYQSDLESLLPAAAEEFFSSCSTADPSISTNLQTTLNAKANFYSLQAANVERMQEQSRRGDKWELEHHKATTATGAWSWKSVRPEGPHLRLCDVEYAIAARLGLGLRPFPARAMGDLPVH